MKLIDTSTNTEIDFKPPHRFSAIHELKLIATAYAYMREYTSDKSVDDLIESLQRDGDTLIVHWNFEPSDVETRDIEWIWEFICGQVTTRHYFKNNLLP